MKFKNDLVHIKIDFMVGLFAQCLIMTEHNLQILGNTCNFDRF